MQNLKSVAALGEELGGKKAKWKTTIFRKSCFLQEKLALRGSLAVTWLTVYRQLQVMRATRAKTPLATHSFGLRPGPFPPVALLIYELKLLNGSKSSSASHLALPIGVYKEMHHPMTLPGS